MPQELTVHVIGEPRESVFCAAAYAPDVSRAAASHLLPSTGYRLDTSLAVNRWHGSPVGLNSASWVLDRAAPFARRLLDDRFARFSDRIVRIFACVGTRRKKKRIDVRSHRLDPCLSERQEPEGSVTPNVEERDAARYRTRR